MSRNTVHEEAATTYSTFIEGGAKFLQIDSYGRDTREIPGKKSQTIQFDKDGATALVAILRCEFGIQ